MYNDIEQAVAFSERNSERQRRVIVYDLGESFSEEDLVAMCRPFGKIIFSMIQRDASGKSEGKYFNCYYNSSHACLTSTGML
jgi:RNA recognition motif-containing protein